jgi:hypothetical protein
MVKLRAGQTLVSTVDETSVVVVRAPAVEILLTCGGVPLVDKAAAPAVRGSVEPGQSQGTLLGKRYADEDLGLELLCTKGGAGTLAVAGTPLGLKDARPLPASD